MGCTIYGSTSFARPEPERITRSRGRRSVVLSWNARFHWGVSVDRAAVHMFNGSNDRVVRADRTRMIIEQGKAQLAPRPESAHHRRADFARTRLVWLRNAGFIGSCHRAHRGARSWFRRRRRPRMEAKSFREQDRGMWREPCFVFAREVERFAQLHRGVCNHGRLR